MPINVLVNGAFGRMGQATVKAINDHPGLNLVGQTGREYDLKKAILDSKAEVVVDFTLPDCVYENTLTILDAKAHPVIGTSGLTPDQIKSLQELSGKEKMGGLIAPNFSIGAVLMMKLSQEVARFMTSVEIIEMHHAAKADSPSGTSLRSAEMLAQVLEHDKEKTSSNRETIPGSRGANFKGIPIHAVRLPGILANQQIIFGNVGETLSIQHTTIDRQCFMPGVLLACEKVVELDHLVYGLEELL